MIRLNVENKVAEIDKVNGEEKRNKRIKEWNSIEADSGVRFDVILW